MLLNEIIPGKHLQAYVRLYRIIDFNFPDNMVIPSKAYPPRPEHCLQFFPTPTAIRYSDASELITPKNAAIVGMHTITNDRIVFKKFLSLQVVFQPGGMFKLLNIPSEEFTNRFTDAEEVLGKDVQDVNEQLYLAKDYQSMILVIESFLHKKLKATSNVDSAIDSVSREMLAEYDAVSLDSFIKKAFLSHRQFDRKFQERMGVGPKEFLRLIRFDKAFRMKNKYPEKDWLTIAIHCGYHDYQHLVKDYKAFTGYTPTRFFERDNQAPERLFGEAET